MLNICKVKRERGKNSKNLNKKIYKQIKQINNKAFKIQKTEDLQQVFMQMMTMKKRVR